MSWPTQPALIEALDDAARAHHEFETTYLHGARDAQWADFYAAFVLGRVGMFTTPSRLVGVLQSVTDAVDWSMVAASKISGTLTAHREGNREATLSLTLRQPVDISE